MTVELEQAIQALNRRSHRAGLGPVDLTPGCAFGAVVDERLKDLDAKVGEIRNRVNALIFTVAAAIIVELVMKVFR